MRIMYFMATLVLKISIYFVLSDMIIIEKSSGSQLKTVWHGTHMKANPIILTSRLGPSLVGSQKVTYFRIPCQHTSLDILCTERDLQCYGCEMFSVVQHV